ncbi:MAG: peptide chain release factor N(5)-glutamine methyltransferase [Rhodospirillaceae bacterium]|nr:peptide chain release factor N(5)-glutamine methyltransferase [Rhodospirillaceae bacterium]
MIDRALSVEDALRQASSVLAAGGIEQPRHEARILLGHVTGLSREALLVQHREILERPLADALTSLARRRAEHEPIAYLTGEREFWGLSFEVTRDTLIPRPDSETLVEAALEFTRARRDAGLRILDLGVGSGCLLISLLRELPLAEGFGVDRSVAALRVAGRNAERHGVSARMQLFAGCWGAALSPSFDIIVANPPYVADGERASMMPEVAKYEPAEALFAGREGEDAYRAMAPQLARLLSPQGRIFLELGAGQGARAAEILHGAGLSECERRKDLAGIERCGIFELALD